MTQHATGAQPAPDQGGLPAGLLHDGADAEQMPLGKARTAPKPRRRRRLLIWIGASLVLVGALAAWSAMRKAEPAPGPVIAESGGATMRAEVRPVRRATLAVINPGTVEAMFVEVGDVIDSKAPIGRVQGPNGAEILVAPWHGTVTTVQVHEGDTLMAGAVVGTMADLSRLQVETVDVDEFQVAKLQPGQMVTLTIDALNQTLAGRIRTVAFEPLVNAAGDSNYLVVIDPSARLEGLRSGMTVRVRMNE